jgi:hypothetical protein
MGADPSERLAALSQALADLRSGALPLRDFSAQARGDAVLLAALPPRYAEVLNNLVDRLESSALFSEESCSFSHNDLIGAVQHWIDKAAAALTDR